MTHDQMLELITRHGVQTMAEAVRFQRYGQVITEGWDITNWTVLDTPGAVLFAQVEYRDEPAGRIPYYTDAPRICCVNAPESERARWEADLAGQGDAPTTLVMAPRGMVAR